MSNLIIELTNAKPVTAAVSDEDKFNIKNALMTKTPFISFTDIKSDSEWTIRADDIITVNITGGK